MKNRLDVFAENYRIARESFSFNSSMEACGCASALIGRPVPVTKEELLAAKELVKKKTGVLSTFGRGSASQPLIATIAVDPDREYAFEQMLRIYQMLDKRFIDSDYLVVAAIMIYKNARPVEYEHIVARTRQIYELIRKDHPMITGREDIVNCTLMALSDIAPEILRERCEENFMALKKYYRSRNNIQYMACMLSIFEGDPDTMAARVSKTSFTLRSLKVSVESCSFPVVAAISALVGEHDLEEVCRAIAKVSDRLLEIRGMGPWGAGKAVRNMVAEAIVIDAYMESANSSDAPSKVGNSVSAAIVSSIIAAETAMIVAVIAAGSAASTCN